MASSGRPNPFRGQLGRDRDPAGPDGSGDPAGGISPDRVAVAAQLAAPLCGRGAACAHTDGRVETSPRLAEDAVPDAYYLTCPGRARRSAGWRRRGQRRWPTGCARPEPSGLPAAQRPTGPPAELVTPEIDVSVPGVDRVMPARAACARSPPAGGEPRRRGPMPRSGVAAGPRRSRGMTRSRRSTAAPTRSGCSSPTMTSPRTR